MGNSIENQHKEIYSEEYYKQKEWIERNMVNIQEDQIEIEMVEGTPFRIAGRKGENNEGWKILCGNQVASYMLFKTKAEAKRYIKKIPWDLMTVLCVEIYQSEEKLKKINEGE